MIAIQPLLIGSFYLRTVLMKSMSQKARKAQNEGSQLASEAIVNHRTITAFSSQKRILHLFGATMRGPRQQSIKQGYISGFGLFSSQFLTTASIALTFWYGGKTNKSRTNDAEASLPSILYVDEHWNKHCRYRKHDF